MTRCKHEWTGTLVTVIAVSDPDLRSVRMEHRFCPDCDAYWLHIGPSTDTPETTIEMRAV